MYAYLLMTAGDHVGVEFPLNDHGENGLGRGLDCQIVLGDPMCSRVHAKVLHRAGQWLVRDNKSLNGTFVNGQKVEEATLANGCYLRVGATEFTFQLSVHPPSQNLTTSKNPAITQTLVQDAFLSENPYPAPSLGGMNTQPQIQHLLLLYQFSIRLLATQDPDEVLSIAIDLLKDLSRAALVGFLRPSDDGELKPTSMPAAGDIERMRLSGSLTRKVTEEKKAVWISNHQARSMTESLQHFSDAVCIPLVSDDYLFGVIHLYLEHGTFDREQFDFAVSIGNVTSVALSRAYREQSMQADIERLQAKSGGFDELIGESQPMQELKAKIRRLGKTSGCVLIRGESGTGKELVARALHRHSTRAGRPMLSVNCAAIPADLMESQLFGHQAGSFTGADRDHRGYFQQADGGTLFLDEAGEMTLEGQAKLLRILEGHPFLPVGATKEISVDVRVIAATNQDLQTYVREKKFREDLYYRLSVFELYIPPLRERGPDIGLLIDYFLEHFRRQHGRSKLKLHKEARAKLLGYHWPGNVRQLRNVMDSAVVLAENDTILMQDLGLRDAGLHSNEAESLRLEDWEQKLIRKALERTDGAVPEAAKLLGIGRATLYRKLDQYGISRK
ncbi:Nitrogen fixation protein VnfA [Planctomycetales bacterium 10988]|nr:Nitrogen fixation protein VnfA [Planctomycetales bacterium 10988]